MTDTTAPTSGFHDGERAVQRRAGVSEEASALSGMLAAPQLDGGVSRFLAARDLAVLTGRDDHGRLWTSPLLGRPGFLEAHGSTLRIHAVPRAGDPLHRIQEGQPVGILALDLALRRRVRVNGTLVRATGHELEIHADQAYGNCPRYMQQRHLDHGSATGADAVVVRHHDALQPEHLALIARSDTFVLGTTHPTRGTDTSHRGGPPGFVRVEAGRLWWPDYPGNNLFNSLGNIVSDPTAALLFVDFAAGTILQISGHAAVEWVMPGVAGDDGGTGRQVRFTPVAVVATTGLPLRAPEPAPSPHNPPTT